MVGFITLTRCSDHSATDPSEVAAAVQSSPGGGGIGKCPVCPRIFYPTGPADYNYDLSQRRANSVIQYLASQKQIPAHKIYLIELGKDKPVETNKTAEGPQEKSPRGS